jgi:hypothetical protein
MQPLDQAQRLKVLAAGTLIDRGALTRHADSQTHDQPQLQKRRHRAHALPEQLRTA